MLTVDCRHRRLTGLLVVESPEASRGFTLIELMVTVAIAAILLTLALPAMRDYILNQRVKSASFDLMSTLMFARSEAIKRNGDVMVVPASSGGTQAWNNGWDVYPQSATCTPDTSVSLRSQSAFDSNVSIPGTTTVCFHRDGRSNAAFSVTVTVSPANANVNPRCISLDLSGRPVSALGTCS